MNVFKTWKKWIAGTLVLCLMALTAAGCNTVEGVGEDIESGGRHLQDAAD